MVATVLALATIWAIGPRVGGPAASSPVGSSAVGSGLSQPSQTLAGSSRRMIAGGISVLVPAGWHFLQLPAPSGAGVALAALANFDLQARCGVEASAAACIASLPLAAGDIIVTIANDDTAMTIAQIAAPSGIDAEIDGMPAALQFVEAPPGMEVTGVVAPPGCDAHRAWWIGRPSSATGWLDIEACSAFADRNAFRAAVDEIARSVLFGS
jgi:hypothetical protein